MISKNNTVDTELSVLYKIYFIYIKRGVMQKKYLTLGSLYKTLTFL